MNDNTNERPTPDVKPMGAVTICRNGYVEALERDLAAVSAQRDALALDAEKWEALHDEMADAIEFEIRRDNHGPLETHAEAIARVIAERDALKAQFTKLDKPKYSGAPMLDSVLSVRNPLFDAWVASLPATYWTRYDLSAARIGWEAATNAKPQLTNAALDDFYAKVVSSPAFERLNPETES